MMKNASGGSLQQHPEPLNIEPGLLLATLGGSQAHVTGMHLLQ